MYTALYRAKRPEIFSEILGQQHIVKILKHQISTDTVSHAYLFCGTRGTGKTTTARILAKAVNCTSEGDRPCGECANCRAIKNGSFMDVIEIDAASNNGVDNIRELRESVKYPPAVGRKKVYIIDEVHMLSSGAFNALLKTLEEPPENVMFILATTEPQKLPATILSRCMRLDFKRVPQATLVDGMREICEEKGVAITESALLLLANCADGSVRDGLSILDQVLASGEKYIERDDVLEYVGAAGEEFFIELTELVSLKKTADALLLLDERLAVGKDVKQMMKDWTAHYRNLLITKFIKKPEDILNMSSENIDKVQEQSKHISVAEIENAILKLSRTINDAKWSSQPRVLMELAIVAIASEFVETAAPVRVQTKVVSEQYASKAESSGFAPQSGSSALSGSSAPNGFEAPSGFAASSGFASPSGFVTQGQGLATSVEDGVLNNNINGAASVHGSGTDETFVGRCDNDILPCKEYDDIWYKVFEEGEKREGSFNILRTVSRLVDISDGTFTVITDRPFNKHFVEDKQVIIEEIMGNIMGRSMRLSCYCKDEFNAESIRGGKAMPSNAESDDELAQKASNILGMEIEIE